MRCMDKSLFRQACDTVINKERLSSGGIGTLGEKTLHSVLKNYFEPDESCHEIKIGRYVADIVTENGIIEIQTRQFNALRQKLAFFLEQSIVTVVYPVAEIKWLLWIDESTGEVTKRRKSPKIGKPYEIFYELYKIRSLLSHPGLRLHIVLLELEEFRTLNGWSRDKKKGSTRYDRIPVDILGELNINNINDYAKLIPEELGSRFTVKDFKAASGLSLYTAGLALNVLNTVGAVVRTGKKGNAYVYERAE
ncbi:MAG: hypothetical protein GXY05_11835 [Clostridiales bacterium]|nr:hypothetical protein [Clostridiales bacterium]